MDKQIWERLKRMLGDAAFGDMVRMHKFGEYTRDQQFLAVIHKLTSPDVVLAEAERLIRGGSDVADALFRPGKVLLYQRHYRERHDAPTLADAYAALKGVEG
jgi:hypothetical protein